MSEIQTHQVSGENAIEIAGLYKWFGAFNVLTDVNLNVRRGERVVICGPSGSGKSTLIRCVNALEDYQRGEIVVNGMELTKNLKRIDEVRREVGMVFQQFNLFPHLTAIDNIALAPRVVKRTPTSAALAKARDLLARVGLADRAAAYPHELSGGQQQRVAIARALVGEPDVIFADEPTGALDTRSGRAVLALLRATVDEGDRTLVMVTHDPSAAAWADRVVFLADGRLAGELHAPTAEQVAERMTGLGA